MKNIGRKLNICLFEPRKIGLFLGEKMSKVIFQLILCCMIIVAPLALKLNYQTEISSNSRNEIKETLMIYPYSNNMKLKDGILTGTDGRGIFLDEFVVLLNPEGTNYDIADLGTYVAVFGKTEVKIYFMGNVISSTKYEEYGELEIDFSKISAADYIEADKFIKVVDMTFAQFHTHWVITSYVAKVIEVIARVLINALILSLLAKFANPFLRYRYRFKASLDTQFIFVVFFLLDVLMLTNYMYLIGMFLSVIYLYRALRAIVPIPIKRPMPDNRKEDE